MCITCGCGGESVHQHHIYQEQKDYLEIDLETAVLTENSIFANHNRKIFDSNRVLALNLLSSPGSGKTTLLEATIKSFSTHCDIYIIEGDQHTKLDAERINKLGVKAYQINTGKNCHLDAHMVNHALEHLNISNISHNGFIFIENVGNLICPALFDLGEHLKVVIISVTEGEDKPLKYPDMFYAADLIIINKIDLLPYLDFDIEKCIVNIQKINNRAKIMQLSASKQNGISTWIKWLYSAQDFYLL